jgi:hypothetical protein
MTTKQRRRREKMTLMKQKAMRTTQNCLQSLEWSSMMSLMTKT